MQLLTIDHLAMQFGGLVAIKDLSMTVEAGTIHGVIGPNGAGKTTLFNAISGRHKVTKGRIRFKDKAINGLKPHKIVAQGLARTFQHVTLFKDFSVLKNMMVGRHLHSGYSYWGALINSAGTRRAEAENATRAREILDFVGLSAVADDDASSLPHGHQRALGIAIALASEPQLLMLDEPCAGMNSDETRTMIELIERIRQDGTSIMLIEHDMKVVMHLCDKITVLNFGTKIAEGTPQEILKNPLVHEAYLGTSANVA
ncbi:MAG: ABC transporter ATP-binding protein [Kiloniellales bacterium]